MFTSARRWTQSAKLRPAAPRRTFRPRLEALEDRTVPSFAAPLNLSAIPGNQAAVVEAADFNNDGVPDLAVGYAAGLPGTGRIDVYLGDGHGGFVRGGSASGDGGLRALVVGDIDRDGNLDVLTANGNSSISVFLGNGNGTLRQEAHVSLPGGPNGSVQQAQNLALGDLNGDGKLDLVVGAWTTLYKLTKQSTFQVQTSLVTALLGRGDGRFRATGNATLFTLAHSANVVSPVPVAIGDINRDGNADVVTASAGQVGGLSAYPPPPEGDTYVYLLGGDGRGRLWGVDVRRDFLDAGFGPASLALGDLNRDGWLDIVATFANQLPGTGGYAGIHVLLIGDVLYLPMPADYYFAGTNDPTAVRVGDINGDGALDIVTVNQSGGVGVLTNNGRGYFQTRPDAAPGSAFLALALADFDGDRDLDLVLLDGASVFEMLNDGIW